VILQTQSSADKYILIAKEVVWEFRDDTISRVQAPFMATHSDWTLEDVDNDGRMDVIAAQKTGECVNCESDFTSEMFFPFLYHRLPDGSFSASDAVAEDLRPAPAPEQTRSEFPHGYHLHATTGNLPRDCLAHAEDRLSRLRSDDCYHANKSALCVPIPDVFGKLVKTCETSPSALTRRQSGTAFLANARTRKGRTPCSHPPSNLAIHCRPVV
jgi:hypothetical protein